MLSSILISYLEWNDFFFFFLNGHAPPPNLEWNDETTLWFFVLSHLLSIDFWLLFYCFIVTLTITYMYTYIYLFLFWVCQGICIDWIRELWGSRESNIRHGWGWTFDPNYQCWLGIQPWTYQKEEHKVCISKIYSRFAKWTIKWLHYR